MLEQKYVKHQMFYFGSTIFGAREKILAFYKKKIIKLISFVLLLILKAMKSSEYCYVYCQRPNLNSQERE